MSLTHRDYLSICQILASASYCKRKQVGAILVKDGNIIAQSYNGTPRGSENECEDELGNTLPTVLHAESNVITKMALSTTSSEGAILYVTLSPCLDCAKLLIQAKIKEVYFIEFYRERRGLELLAKHGINVTKI